MRQKAKEKLASVRMYGRRVSEFLLPDQMEFIEKAMVEFTQEQANDADTGQDKCHIQRVSGALPPALVLYRAANTMTFEDFAKWYNGKSGNDH